MSQRFTRSQKSSNKENNSEETKTPNEGDGDGSRNEKKSIVIKV